MKTQVWAHRGASGWDVQYAPENTMPAFALAVQMGADGIELDVQLTRDGEVVICHDERLERVSDGIGWLKDYTLAELKRFNFSKLHPEYGFTEIPTLKELFSFMRGNALQINIELKTGMIFYDGIEEKVVQMAQRMGMGDRIIYSSFNHVSLCLLKQVCPEARAGVLYEQGFVDLPGYPRKLRAAAVHPYYRLVDAEYIRRCHEAGLMVNAWTVDVKTEMQRLCEAGIDALITDCPDSGRRIADGDYSIIPVMSASS